MPEFKPLKWTVLAMGVALAALSGVSIGQAATAVAEKATSPSALGFWPIAWHTRDNDVPQLLAQQQQSRTALVIGNAAYSEDALTNPANDANDVAEALRSLGFEVTLVLDADLKAMEEALDTFSRQLNRGGVGVFYYAGHGVQVEGENYLIPLTANLTRQNDVRYEAVPLGKVLNAMETSEAKVNVVIIDACRDNPFYRRWRSGDRTLSSERGLAFEVPPEGTIISFATGPDDVAADGEGRNSPYTASLLQHINIEGEDVATMFRRVRADVIQATRGEQIPWYQESLVGSFSFNPASAIAIAPAPPEPTVSPTTSLSIEEGDIPIGPRYVPIENFYSRLDPTELISKFTGTNYQPLRDALAIRDFREADELSKSLILQAVGKEPEGKILVDDFKNFPCEDLRIVNQLWLDYSRDRFGFSIQQGILQKLAQEDERFSLFNFLRVVGWSHGDISLSLLDPPVPFEYMYSTSSPEGHLPTSISVFSNETYILPVAFSFLLLPISYCGG